MKTGYKNALIVIFCILSLIFISWVMINHWQYYHIINIFGVDANIILTFALVVVTAIYVGLTNKIVKQGANRDRIAYLERMLEKLYVPMMDFLDFLDAKKSSLDISHIDIPELHKLNKYRLNSPDHEIGIEMVNKFAPFKYLAKEDVQELFLDIHQIFYNGGIDVQKWDGIIDAHKANIKRDIEIYSDELESLIKVK